MKISKTNAMRELEKTKIFYQAHSYDHGDGAIDGVSVAHKLGQNPDQVFKTLVTQATSKQYYVFVIPVAKELNLKAAARSVGEKSVEMIPVKEINKVTGYIRRRGEVGGDAAREGAAAHHRIYPRRLFTDRNEKGLLHGY